MARCDFVKLDDLLQKKKSRLKKSEFWTRQGWVGCLVWVSRIKANVFHLVKGGTWGFQQRSPTHGEGFWWPANTLCAFPRARVDQTNKKNINTQIHKYNQHPLYVFLEWSHLLITIADNLIFGLKIIIFLDLSQFLV